MIAFVNEKCTHNRHRAGQDLRDVRRHAGPDHVDVVGDAAYDVAGLIFRGAWNNLASRLDRYVYTEAETEAGKPANANPWK